MSAPEFVHFRTQSEFSLLESLLKANEIPSLAADFSMPAVALADLNTLAGILDFSESAVKTGVQPILGLDQEIHFVRSESNSSLRASSLLLIVQNEEGYSNILKINELFLAKRLKSEQTIIADLYGKTNGIIAISGFENGLLFQNSTSNWRQILSKLIELFPDRFYLEIQRYSHGKFIAIEEFHLEIAAEFNLPIIATNKVFFAIPEDSQAHDALICIKDTTYVSVENRRKSFPEYNFRSPKIMVELFADLPQALENSINLAKRCAFLVKSSPVRLPKYSIDEDFELTKLSRIGLSATFSKNSTLNVEKYTAQLEYELQMIIKMGFAGYFLIVADFINWSKSQNIPVGPGRGSVVGSIVAWALGITDVDPIRFGLLFERFLNPDRISMPDIDIDFCQNKRQFVIEYIKKRYGVGNVAHIATFGALQARAALRDAGRVLGLPYSQVDAICRRVPNNPANPIGLEEAINLDKDLQQLAREEESIDNFLKISLKLEGTLRNRSTHAAGVVITDVPLNEIVPIDFDPDSMMPMTQYHMKAVEKAGLIKFDFLGLTTLTLLKDAQDLVEKHQGLIIDITTIDLDDKRTYKDLSTGENIGIFQLESGIMKSGIRKITPEKLEDLMVLLALNRPGPMENLPEYIARRMGFKSVDYILPNLEELLRETYGIIIYQEQVMEIAKIVGGYTLAQADILRRAMGKKIKEEMDMQKNFFIEGAVKNEIEPMKAESIFELVAKFAGYGFNKSHAVAYALISYRTAWMKSHYPLEFMCALMSLEFQNTDKLSLLKAECDRLKIPVLPPDLNKSEVSFSIEKRSIRYALNALKNVGSLVAQEIYENRGVNGEFKNLSEFLLRISQKAINKRTLESLIKSGALTSVCPKTHSMLEQVEAMIAFTIKIRNSQDQLSLFFGYKEFELIESSKVWTTRESLSNEFFAIGFYLTKNPLDLYSEFISDLGCLNKKKIVQITKSTTIRVAAVVSDVHIRSSKRGKFANLLLTLEGGLEEMFIYDSNLIQKNAENLKVGKALILTVKANLDQFKGELRLQIIEIQDLFSLVDSQVLTYEIEISDEVDVSGLKSKLKRGNGKCKIALVYFTGTYKATVELQGQFSYIENLEDLRNCPGVGKIQKIF